jgi:hypothetical protein
MILGQNGTVNEMRIFIILVGLFISTVAQASTTINCQIVRNEAGSGITQISSGFPLPPGLVTEAMVTGGTIKVYFNGSEVDANVTGLRGRHSDGTLRSVLIQFLSPSSMTQSTPVSGSVVVDGGARTNSDPTYIRPTYAMVLANNVILPAIRTGTGYEAADRAYLASTEIAFQKVLTAGAGTAEEEKQYTTLAAFGFDALVAAPNEGTATYEDIRGIVALWAKTGDIKYINQAITRMQVYIADDTKPATYGGADCQVGHVINPDGRSTSFPNCDALGEQYFPRTFSYASLYLLTGYRDFWGLVSEFVQRRWYYGNYNDQTFAESNNVPFTGYDSMRTNYSSRYGGLMAAYMIDATVPVNHRWYSGTAFTDWEDQLNWVLNAFEYQQWDFKWIPFDSGTGTVPAYGTTVTKGAATATVRGVYTAMHDRMNYAGTAMPTSGYILINNTSGFTAGTLTFSSGTATASATGAEVTDYRQGLVGTRVDSPRTFGSTPYCLPTFQMIFPLHFLIDYYLNVNADSRIPDMIKKNIDIYIKNVHPLVAGDHNYGDTNVTWGNPAWGNGYPLENPVDRAIASPWNLGEFTRMIAFVLKTVPDAGTMNIPDADGNTATYATWYSRFINTGNNWGLVNAQWKLFGQFYGFASDTPWIMAQSSLPAPTYREPTHWSAIPGETPDLARIGGGGGPGNKWKIKTITDDN